MRTQAERAVAFRALHERPGAFIIPNPWETWVRAAAPSKELNAIFKGV